MANERCPDERINAAIIDSQSPGKNYKICMTYENSSNITGLVPSPEFCPTCQYNGTQVRKQAKEDISKK